ncbi:hypothetical protein KK083_13395 [Fulvivirgaceae bacterium PWU4]|uniref:Uncharacterized protein n=1 Tax=Chryseosolibacter histidini TaxID=2782349 RepID=A0AAP2GJ22_9BACT|nr:hypothetical protein [Chryseosolibacter histidini]MBT1697881.1 hypothetical protein [Chryseosolibacter histidini]
MKRTPLLITAGIVLFVILGYYAYDVFLVKDPVRPWDLVPADAMIVYEKNNCNACLEEVNKSSLFNIIETAASYKKPVDSIRNRIGAVLKDKQGFLISVHITKKDDFDFIYYLPYSSATTEDAFAFPKGNYRRSTREFNSVQIQELRFSGQVFSYATIGEVWIGSFTPFLIEDVIRTYETTPASERKKNRPSQQGFSSIQDDGGNVYVRLKIFSDWLSLFTAKPLNFALGESALLDLKSNGNSVVLNGFSYDSLDRSTYMLSAFRHQSPVSFGLKHVVSNRTIAVSSYGISDGAAFYGDLQKFVKQKNRALSDTLLKLSSTHNLKLENLYKLISDEFSVCFLESLKGRKLSRILLVESKQPEQWLQTLNTVSEKLSVDTVFFERYSQYEIREVPVFRFSEKLLWPFVSGFDQNFYTSVGQVIIIADNLEELKRFLDDIEAEDTWGKSVSQNRFLESTLLESNVSLYFNPAKAWNVLSADLQPRWSNFVRDNQPLLQSLQMSSIQFSHLNNSFYTNALFTYKPFVATAKPEKGGDKFITNFQQGISSLHAVRSHVNRSNEILIQDSLNDLSLLSSEGKLFWKVPIGDRIISDVTQIDFFNNGKLQYFFSTSSAIHIIDRLGNYVDPYPLHLPTADIEHVSVIDYDNSKRYRILIADKKGKLMMYDKSGALLEGWNPKDVGGSLAMPPRHHRIKGKDYILAVRKDGQVFLMNRRGENLKKFPLNLEAIPSGDYALEVGSTISDTYFVLVSRDGFKIRFTVEGKLQGRETLLKTSVTSNFSLIGEKSNKSYLILQQDGKQLTIADESGKRILSNNIVGLSPSDIKYFDFGAGNAFIGLIDRTQGLSYIYDSRGNLLTEPPLESTAIEVRPINSEQFRVFFIHGKSLVIQPL